MTWYERAALISIMCTSVANLSTSLWNLMRSCQTYHIVKNRKPSKAEDQ